MTLTTQWSRIHQLNEHEATAAWQWFVDRYRGFVGAALRRLIWSPERAASATDEFWGYLFQSGALQRPLPPARFRAFLVGTLRNYARGWIRRNPLVPQQEDGVLAEAREPQLSEEDEIGLWVRQVLHHALARLEREQPRWARALKTFYGLPNEIEGAAVEALGATDLATELGCTRNALHQLLHRARQGLRNCLVDEIRQTVVSRSDLDAEVEALLGMLARIQPGLVAESMP